jgi:hypothetical protein
MPTPNSNETKQQFVSRCIEYMMKEGGREQKQCIAICYSIWDNKDKKNVSEKINRILGEQGTVTKDVDMTPANRNRKRRKRKESPIRRSLMEPQSNL